MVNPRISKYTIEASEAAYCDNGNMAEIIDWLVKTVTHEDTFVDVGAHVGCMFIPTVTETKPKRAIAIEPTPETFGFLKKNCKQLKVPYELCNMAVSDKTGETMMYDCSWGSPSNTLKDRWEGKHPATIPVKTIALGDMKLDGPIVLKIDAELSEPEVWEGLRPHFSKIRAIIMEMFIDGYDGAGIKIEPFIEQIRKDGFEIYNLDEKPMSDTDILISGKTDVILKNALYKL